MARYAKTDVRIWGDEKVREMTPIPPCGQGLWIRLLVSKFRSSVPGLICAGEAALAEDMGWSLEDFRKAYAEVSSQGLAKADWKARVVWLPNAISYNVPESPNVVKSWRIPWDETPDCPLKLAAFHRLKAFLEGYKKPFSDAFAKACKQPSGKPWANQEQEQEQEQKESLSARDPSTTTTEHGAQEVPNRPNGYSLCQLFGRLRREILELQCAPGAEYPPDANGKAGSFAERMDPSAFGDVEPTMRAFLLHLKNGDDGWNADPGNASLSFGAWRDRFGDLRAELSGDAPKVAPRQGKQQQKQVTYDRI